MKKLLAIISLFTILFSSCQKDETVFMSSGLETLKCTIESAGTKATLENSNATTGTINVTWEEDDYISVFVETSDGIKNVKYQLANGANTTIGEFNKVDNIDLTEATVVAAVYPYTQNATYEYGVIAGMTLDDNYVYNEQVKAAPMAAKANGNTLSFKNVGALVRVSTANLPVSDGYNAVELSSATGKLSGNYSISLDENGIPTAAFTGATSNAISYTVEANNPTLFFPVFAGSYSDFTVKAKGAGKNDITLIAPKALNAERNKIYYTSSGYISSNDAVVTVSGSDHVTVTLDNTNSSIVVNAGSGNTPKYVNLILDGATNASLTVNLPQSTVLLSGTSTYTSITSATAQNTLILGSGVTAELVIVKQGNIQVNEDAALHNVDLSAVPEITIIDNGGTIPDSVINNDKVTVVSMEEVSLNNAFAEGGTYVLSSNVDLTSNLTLPNGKTLVLDLNGYTISHTKECSNHYAMITNKGTLTITGEGVISFEDLGEGPEGSGWGTYTIRNEGNLTISLDNNNGKLEHKGPRQFTAGQGDPIAYVIDNHTAGAVTVNSGIISSPKSRSIRNFYTNADIIINGGTFEGQIWMQQGNATGSGDHTTKVGNLTINGGNFSPAGADGSSIFITNHSADNVNLSVTGGFFNTKIGCNVATHNGVQGKITGGTFTESAKSNTPAALLATGYIYKQNDNGNYDVVPAQN